MTQPVLLQPESPLVIGLRWFVGLRWLAGITITVVAVVATWQGWTVPTARILGVGIAVLLYNGLLSLSLPRRLTTDSERRKAIPSSTVAAAQIMLDLLCLTLLIVWTGGPRSPLMALVIVHMIFASMLLPWAIAYAMAAASVLMLLIGFWVTDQFPTVAGDLPLVAGVLLAMLLTVHLAGRIARTLLHQHAEAQRHHHRAEGIVAAAVDGIITIDRSGTMLSANAAAERIFGYSASEMIGQNVRLLMGEPDSNEHASYLSRYLATGEARIIGIGREVEGRGKDGRAIPLDLAVGAIEHDGEPLFVGILRDISGRKQIEDDLRRANQRLREQQDAMVQHEKMTAIGRMAAGLVHEISNPLASLDSLLQLAERHPDRLQTDTIHVARQQIDRANEIVRQTTSFTHPLVMQRERRSVNDLVDEALALVNLDHRVRSAAIERNLSAESGSVMVNPQAIHQVLINLIENALDAVEHEDAPTISIETNREDRGWSIRVIDNGTGIAPEHIDRVFEPFFTTKDIGRGTGLGLAVSYSLIQSLEGRIKVESSFGNGSVFRVWLPAAPASHGQEPDDGTVLDHGNPTEDNRPSRDG